MNLWPTLSRYTAALALLAGACADAADPGAPEDGPAEYIAVRRAWLPGERDSTIARIVRDGGFGPFSQFAAQIYSDPDSVTVIALNPAFEGHATARSRLRASVSAPRFGATWNIAGIRWIFVKNDVTPVPDSTIWTGFFWSNPTEATWRGFLIRAGLSATFGSEEVMTTTFDASGGKTGAGGGEVRLSDGTEWTAIGPANAPPNRPPGVPPGINYLEMTAATFGTPTSVTTGPFLGGTQASGTMNGRAKKVEFTRIGGTTAPASFEVDYDFRTVGIPGVEVVCIFPSPCTTNVPAVHSALRRAYSVGGP